MTGSLDDDRAALHLTVAICTRNRSAELVRTLAQMERLVFPDGVTWELLVVNNGSSDDTDGVIDSFVGRLPIRRALEPLAGLSNARNRALAEASGTYILWTDDDVDVDADWIGSYVRAVRRWPEAVVFGGPIEPLFEGEPPAWLPRVIDQVGAVYGRQSLGDQPVALATVRPGSGPYGGNMAMRTEVLRRFPFNPSLGTRPGQYSIGEETDVVRRMLEAGHSGWWTPEPRVQHRIPEGSQNLAYVRRWMVGAGRYRAQSLLAQRVREPFQSWPWLVARIVRYEFQFRVRRHIVAPEGWIGDLIRASQARGQLQVLLEKSTVR